MMSCLFSMHYCIKICIRMSISLGALPSFLPYLSCLRKYTWFSTQTPGMPNVLVVLPTAKIRYS